MSPVRATRPSPAAAAAHTSGLQKFISLRAPLQLLAGGAARGRSRGGGGGDPAASDRSDPSPPMLDSICDSNIAAILAFAAVNADAIGVLRHVCRRFRDIADSSIGVWEHVVLPDMPVHCSDMTVLQLSYITGVCEHARRRNVTAQLSLSSALWIHAERAIYAAGAVLPAECDAESLGDLRLVVTQLPRLITCVATHVPERARATVIAAFTAALDAMRGCMTECRPRDHERALVFLAHCTEALEVIGGLSDADAAFVGAAGTFAAVAGPALSAAVHATGPAEGGVLTSSMSWTRLTGLPQRLRSLALAAAIVASEGPVDGAAAAAAAAAPAALAAEGSTPSAAEEAQLRALLVEDQALLYAMHEACCELVVRQNGAMSRAVARQRPCWLGLRRFLTPGTPWRVKLVLDLRRARGYSCERLRRATAGSVEWVIMHGDTIIVVTSEGELFVHLARPGASYVACDREAAKARTAHVSAGPTSSAGLFFVLAPPTGKLFVFVVSMVDVAAGFEQFVRGAKRIMDHTDIDGIVQFFDTEDVMMIRCTAGLTLWRLRGVTAECIACITCTPLDSVESATFGGGCLSVIMSRRSSPTAVEAEIALEVYSLFTGRVMCLVRIGTVAHEPAPINLLLCIDNCVVYHEESMPRSIVYDISSPTGEWFDGPDLHELAAIVQLPASGSAIAVFKAGLMGVKGSDLRQRLGPAGADEEAARALTAPHFGKMIARTISSLHRRQYGSCVKSDADDSTLLALVQDGLNGMAVFAADIDSIHARDLKLHRVVAADMFAPASAEGAAIAAATSLFPWPERHNFCTGAPGTLTVWKSV